MKRLAQIGLGLLLLIALGGCSAESNGAKGREELIQLPTAPIPAPDLDEDSNLFLLEGGKKAEVGDPVSDAEMLYPQPERRAATFRDLPQGFGPEYNSHGWETETEGFGVISLQNQVVVAVRSEQGVDENRLQSILTKYRSALGSKFAAQLNLEEPAVQNSWARYWFVEDGSHRLMVCAVRVKSSELNVTVALGYDKAMDALRMGPVQARNDLERARSSSKP